MAIAAAHRLTFLDEVDSTNAEALRLARNGEPGPVWILAERQSAGHGRRGRAWHSPQGNLFATFLLTEQLQPEKASLLGLVAALALRDAVAIVAPDVAHKLALKWPNDLLLGGAKLAGILIEAETVPETPGASRMAIGIGCNCASSPQELSYSTASLAGQGCRASAVELFHALSHSWALWLAHWREPGGFALIRDRWLDHATGLGEPIIVRLPTKELAGTFEDLDRQGRLILKDQAGARTVINYGEVFFGTPTKADL